MFPKGRGLNFLISNFFKINPFIAGICMFMEIPDEKKSTQRQQPHKKEGWTRMVLLEYILQDTTINTNAC